MSTTILVVDDDPVQRRMLSTLIRKRFGYDIREAENGHEALTALRTAESGTVQLVVLDIMMPIMDGMETLEILAQQYPGLPVIMLTGKTDVRDAVEAMRLGATDFMLKPFDAERMSATIRNALKIGMMEREISRLKKKDEGLLSFEDLIGYDHGLSEQVRIGRKAAASDIPVFLSGETGVGKDIFARALHGESMRGGGPFIAINCGAIPQTLIESVLFGHEKGAFTGAVAKTAGKFREADGGTIFLDEVGELPLDAQVKLLRVLQQKEVEPVGAGTTVPVNVRIVSATNRDLAQDVRAGRFREDLFFRLNVLPISLPPLRQRKTDISALTQHFIERFCAGEGKPLKDISSSALRALSSYSWPGNIRELENTIHRALILSEGPVLEEGDFPLGKAETLSDGTAVSAPLPPVPSLSLFTQEGKMKSLEDIEQEAMLFALRHAGHNITEAARLLGMAKSTFYRKLKN
jgi:DNA-binding NtrC family response regulator